jgi:hypothetical protein
MGGPGDQAHFSRRLAWADHAQEPGLVSPFDPEGAKAPGPEQVEFVCRFAGPEEVETRRQAPPTRRPGQSGGLEEPGEGGQGRGLHGSMNTRVR